MPNGVVLICKLTQAHTIFYATVAQKSPVFSRDAGKSMFKKSWLCTPMYFKTQIITLLVITAQEKVRTTCHVKSKPAASW